MIVTLHLSLIIHASHLSPRNYFLYWGNGIQYEYIGFHIPGLYICYFSLKKQCVFFFISPWERWSVLLKKKKQNLNDNAVLLYSWHWVTCLKMYVQDFYTEFEFLKIASRVWGFSSADHLPGRHKPFGGKRKKIFF